LLAFTAACGDGGGGRDGLTAPVVNQSFGCYFEGVRMEGNRPGELLPLAVGETRVFVATVDLPSAPSCHFSGTFTRLEWISDSSGQETTEARLIACEACTVLYQGRRETAPGRLGVRGAADLIALPQRVHFEVTGLKPGRGDLAVFACLDEHCVQGAFDDLAFWVSAATR
jgi:hypothetical protein